MLDTRSNIALACALSALAGYVDGIGFIHLGGLFVSFMSGNSTRLGVTRRGSRLAKGTAGRRPDRAVRDRRRRRQPDRASAAASIARSMLLLVEAPAARGAALCGGQGMPELADCRHRAGDGAGERRLPGRRRRRVGADLRDRRAGQGRAVACAALTGGPRWAWLPNLLLWAALAVGVVGRCASPITGSSLTRSGSPPRWRWCLQSALLRCVRVCAGAALTARTSA